MSDDTWLIITAGDAPRVWNLGQPDDATRERLVCQARVASGFPPDWTPINPQGWDVQLTLGEPHHTLMARAAVGTVDELDKVDPAAVAAYVDEVTAASRAVRVVAAREVLAQLDPADRAAVVAEATDAAGTSRAAMTDPGR